MKLKHRFLATLLAIIYLFSSMVVYAAEESTAVSEDSEETAFCAIQTPEDYGTIIESTEASGIETVAEGAILIDADTGAVLYSRNASEKYYPASITKIMTTLVALENGNLSDEMTFTADTLYAIEQGSSRVGVEPGEICTLEDALHCVMLASGNDAAAGVAEHIGGSVQGFVDMMNAKAAELGCTNTHFENPHGLHGETHYTCAEDMAKIAREAMKNPDFVRISSSISYNMAATNKSDAREIWQHHKMLLPSSDYAYKDVSWGKTGFTSMALNTLVTAAQRDSVRLIAVILRCQGAANTYYDTTKLFNYGFDTYSKLLPLENFSLKTAAASCGISEKEIKKLEKMNILYNGNYSILAPKSVSLSDILVSVTTDTAAEGIWGSIIFKYGEQQIGKANIYYNEKEELESIKKNENSITATAMSKLPFVLVTVMVILLLIIVFLMISLLFRRR